MPTDNQKQMTGYNGPPKARNLWEVEEIPNFRVILTNNPPYVESI